eukprot:sb/3463711/
MFIVAVLLVLYPICRSSTVPINSPCHPEHERIQSDISIVKSGRQKRAASSSKQLLWPNGTIPYQISQKFDKKVVKNIRKAIKTWEAYTCLRFVPLKKQPFGLEFEPQDCGCCSFVGMQQFPNSKPQGISITKKECEDVGSILHEIGHAIGFWHEHARPDRDKYVKVLYKNIRDDSLHNFDLKNGSEVDSLGMRYDYNSIMHYGRTAFNLGDMDTLVPVRSKHLSIGQRVELSVGDIRQTNKLYKCGEDGDQCLVNNGGCQHYCIDLPRGRKCSCKRGYVPDGTKCVLMCDRWMEGSKGVIYSVNYPYNYPPDTSCMWDIRAPLGHHIRLRFHKFSLESSVGCVFDALHVRRFQQGWETVAVLCGQETPRNLVVKSDSVRILFKSDRTVSSTGFKITYTTIKSLCMVQPKKCGRTTPQKRFLPSLPTTNGLCNSEIVGRQGELYLPNTGPYTCQIKIRSRAGRKVILVVRDMVMGVTEMCQEEKLEVLGTKGTPVDGGGVLCGNLKGHVIRTGQRLVKITIETVSERSHVNLSFFTSF